MGSDANLKTWVSHRLYSLLGYSQPTVVQYMIGLAKKASSPPDVVGNLTEFGFSSSDETRAFTEDIFSRVPRASSSVNKYQIQEREAAMLAKKQKTYQLLDADDEEEEEDTPKPSAITSAEPRKGDLHKKCFRKKQDNQDDEQDDKVVINREESRRVRQKTHDEDDDDDSEFEEEQLRDLREREELERHMKERDASRTRKLTEAKLSKKEEEEAIRRSNAVEQKDVAYLRKVSRQECLKKREEKKIEELNSLKPNVVNKSADEEGDMSLRSTGPINRARAKAIQAATQSLVTRLVAGQGRPTIDEGSILSLVTVGTSTQSAEIPELTD